MSLELRAKPVFLVSKVKLDTVANVVIQDWMACLEDLAPRVRLENLAESVLMVCPEKRVLLEMLDLMVLWDCLVNPVKI